MYVTQSNACSAPNSANPPSQKKILANLRELGRMETRVRNAEQAFACLLNRPDLNTNGWPVSTHGGTPSSTISGCPTPNAADTQIAVQGPTEPTTPQYGLNLVGFSAWPRRLYTLPEHRALPPNLRQAFAQPSAPPMQPLTTQAHTAQAQQTAAKAAASTNSTPATCPPFPTTGNLCLDIALNYVDPSQVSATQLAACAEKGYSGNKNGPLLTPAMIACRAQNYGSLPKIPDNPNVPQATPALLQQYGMSGLGDWDSCSFLTGLVASLGVAASAIYLWNQAKRMGYV